MAEEVDQTKNSASKIDQLPEILLTLARLRHETENLEYLVVQLLRESGATWEDVGEKLDISRQAAARRFSHVKPRRQA